MMRVLEHRKFARRKEVPDHRAAGAQPAWTSEQHYLVAKLRGLIACDEDTRDLRLMTATGKVTTLNSIKLLRLSPVSTKPLRNPRVPRTAGNLAIEQRPCGST
jgi:hypothetical protein